jgi:acyl-CoA synthetase (AMP-forming)/AMP-acid ligase II
MQTGSRSLLEWLDEANPERGVHFGQANGEWDYWSYRRLAALSRTLAQALVARGLREQQVVSIVQQSGPEFVATFFGTLLAGGTPSPIAPHLAFQDPAEYRAHVAALVEMADSAFVVTAEEFAPALRTALNAPSAVQRVVNFSELIASADGCELPRAAGRASHALLQYTSGSSGRARGVCVPYAALEANLEALRRWLQWSWHDIMACWLPVHHDMGLIGCLLWPVVSGNDLWLLRPEQFLRRPLSYLQCFGAGGATIGAIPPFGLDYVVRRVRQSALQGLDFSGWKGIVIGAERIEQRSLDAFWSLLAPFGLAREALVPAYGLAESTLVVTGVPPGRGWRGVEVDASLLASGANVSLPTKEPSGHREVVVGCGVPVHGTCVSVVDDAGAQVPDGVIGEIVVQGESLASGYLVQRDSLSLTAFSENRLGSGDAGFLLDGELYVLGRIGDSLKIRGRVLFAEDLEVGISALGVPRGRVAVLLGLHRAVATVVVLLESARGTAADSIRNMLQQRTEGAEVLLIFARSGSILRTSSGKPKRRLLWKQYTEGVLAREAELTPALSD